MTITAQEAEIGAALQKRDLPQAVALADAALAQGHKSPMVLSLAAYGLELRARYDDALQVLGEALRLAPNDPRVLNSIGVCQSKASRPREALAAFEAAISAHPGFAPAHHGMGLSLAALGDTETAWAAHEQAARLDPNYADPLGALGAISADKGDWDSAVSYAERALALDPACSTAVVTLAQADLRKGDFERVERRVAGLLADPNLPPLHRAAALHVRADALEGAGKGAEAMEAYAAANAEFSRAPLADMERAGSELGVEMCARLSRYFEKASADDWRPASTPKQGRAAQHVFLVGFPRSGTTLLEQVLASHSDVVALEEKNTLDDVFRGYFSSDEGLDKLAHLSPEEEERVRSEYWERVRGYGVDADEKVFIDKQPLYSLLIPAIAKLFPEARIIVARRDPRDVVLSCFRNRFRANPLLIEFTDLERTALLYDGVMHLTELFESKFGLPTHVVRHEHLIEDLDGELGALCAFLGIPFDERMRQFKETAERRDIRTPSAAQVRRGLNSEGVGRWKRYGPAVDGILPILEPWVRKFGYAA